jgi:mitochondrial import receptor subunit TOM40
MDSGEKPTIASSSTSMLSLSSFALPNLVPQFFTEYQERLSEWRDRLGLLNPGTCENLHKEVMRDVFLTNHMFSGMRADLGKSFSANPLFQIQHSFSAGSSQVAPWSFLSMYSTDNVSALSATVDNRSFCKETWTVIYNSWHDATLPSTHKT